VLVNWNALELTSGALRTLQEHTQGIEYEVFVIDNGSTRDDSVKELPRRHPWMRFIANPDNRGFSKANNQGTREASGRYVVLLNNDTLQIANALGESVRYMDAHPDVGALGIQHLNHDEGRTCQPSFFSFPEPRRDVLGLLGLVPAAPAPPPTTVRPPEQDVDWVCGSYLFMRRECLDQVGLLDERFFIYDEDIDWCLRAHRAGWKVRFWPGAAMVHLGAAARPFMRDKTFVHFRSHLSYLRKHHSAASAALYYLVMSARLSGATAKQALRFAAGKASAEELLERLRRQRQFVFLRPGRTGG